MNNNETMYHIGLKKEDIKGAKYAILPGDPDRVDVIASHLEEPTFLNSSREFRSFLGRIHNEYVLVISTGIGAPSTAICIEELAQIGIENLIRVGTSGGMQLEVEAGDLVIASSAIREDGVSGEYLPIEFPAVANFDLVTALAASAKNLGYRYHIGTVHSKDSFYGQHHPEKMPISYELEQKWSAYVKGGTLCSEMEASALFITSQALKLKAAAILLVIWNQEREAAGLPQEKDFDVEKEIKVAIDAIKHLIEEENA